MSIIYTGRNSRNIHFKTVTRHTNYDRSVSDAIQDFTNSTQLCDIRSNNLSEVSLLFLAPANSDDSWLSPSLCDLYKLTTHDLVVLPVYIVKQHIWDCFQRTVHT